MNVGAPRDAFLHTSEWRDGFPEEQPFVLNEKASWLHPSNVDSTL